MTKLADHLISTPPREVAGSDAASRFHYQAVYGLTLIFGAHAGDGDYALLFELHDDLALLDDRQDPKLVSFFQVKTKEKGAWSLADITRQPKTKDKEGNEIEHPSHIGKIYHNAIQFEDFVDSITFVSNAQMNFGMKSSSFNLTECEAAEISKVVAQIQKEHPGVKTVNTKVLKFAASNLSLGDLDAHAKGKLNDFVVKNLGEVEFSLDVLYRAIVSECTRKSRDKQLDATLPEVIVRRGVTRSDTEAWLTVVKQRVSIPGWDSFASELHLPALQKAKVRREWTRYCAEVLDSNAAVRAVRGEISRTMDEPACGELLTLQEVIDYVQPKIEPFAKKRLAPVSLERLKVMIVYEAFARAEA